MDEAFVDLASDEAALLRLLRRYGLAVEEQPLRIRMLTGGISSNIFVVELPDRSVCVKQALSKLRVAKEWRAPISRVFAEIDWLRTAAALLPGHVPTVLGVDDLNNAFIMEYLPPQDHANWKVQLLAGHIDPAVGTQLGNLLGRLHAGTARDPALARRFAHDANFFALRLEPYLLEAARFHTDLAGELSNLVHATQTHPYALVHGDVSPKNILRGPHGLVLLDAECAWYGDPAFDLAFILNHILLKSVLMDSMTAEYAALFDNIVREYRRHSSWESPRALEARAAALLPGLMLARIDGKSPVEYLDETRRGLIRDAARSLLSRPPSTLADVSSPLLTLSATGYSG